MIENNAVLFAFSLTLFAGLATGIGSALAFFAKRTNTRFLCVSLGFSAGVMIYVAFVEILPNGRDQLMAQWGRETGSWSATAAFFGGMLLIALIDKLVPSEENPHETSLIAESACGPGEACPLPPDSALPGGTLSANARALKRTGLLTALAIGVHNFPEGLATFTAALTEPALGVAIAVAIAIHNIPEGIAVSVPVYYATGSRKKAFFYSFASGLAEPAGALVGYLLLMPFLTPAVMGLLFAMVAGIMVFISIDELLPTAETYGEHHLCIYGLCAGMVVMAFSLLMFL